MRPLTLSVRRAFTLIEIMVALVVTSLVVSLAYAATQAGFDTEERLTRARDGAESEAVARTLIADALRHAVPGIRGGTPVFTISDVRDAGGGTSHGLRFVTRGLVPPLGTSAPWEMTLWPGPEGLTVRARPLEGSESSGISALLPNVKRIGVRVRSRDHRAGWLGAWTDIDVSPTAVSIAFLDAAGRPLGPPLVVRIGLEQSP
jgi:prepilin-type N-terminal cleavage/methylation domain-containing protein